MAQLGSTKNQVQPVKLFSTDPFSDVRIVNKWSVWGGKHSHFLTCESRIKPSHSKLLPKNKILKRLRRFSPSGINESKKQRSAKQIPLHVTQKSYWTFSGLLLNFSQTSSAFSSKTLLKYEKTSTEKTKKPCWFQGEKQPAWKNTS